MTNSRIVDEAIPALRASLRGSSMRAGGWFRSMTRRRRARSTVIGAGTIALGIAMNSICLLINGGMPVLDWARESNWAHHRATASDALPWLWDRVVLPFGFIVSAGDLVLAVGLLMILGGLSTDFLVHRKGLGVGTEPRA
jgi:hypothetical protein